MCVCACVCVGFGGCEFNDSRGLLLGGGNAGGGQDGAHVAEGPAEEDPEPDCEEEGEGDVGVAAVWARH